MSAVGDGDKIVTIFSRAVQVLTVSFFTVIRNDRVLSQC